MYDKKLSLLFASDNCIAEFNCHINDEEIHLKQNLRFINCKGSIENDICVEIEMNMNKVDRMKFLIFLDETVDNIIKLSSVTNWPVPDGPNKIFHLEEYKAENLIRIPIYFDKGTNIKNVFNENNLVNISSSCISYGSFDGRERFVICAD